MGYQGRKSFDASSAVSPARLAALKVCTQLRKRDAFAQDLIDKYIDDSSMKAEDRAFATKLVLGVVSSRGTLDDILDRCMNDPSDVKEDVRDALRISAYEIVFLQKGPHAAVDQGVELVRTFAPKASGVANAILRKVVTAKDDFPFGDPMREMDAFARQHSFPLWLAEELVATMGPDEAHSFMEVCNEPAPVFIALNEARGGEDVLGTLTAAHDEPKKVVLEGIEIPGCFKLNSGQVLADGRLRRLLNNGHLLVSDAASQAVSSIVLPENKPSSMLEIGAGRATKTILIQSNALRNWGSQIEDYVTLDNHAFKTKLLTERAQQYGINVSEALTGDATALEEVLGERKFDAVFIDAPCTGLGTLRRHPEIRWRLKPETIDEYAELGLSMLKEASKHVSKGGTLSYATCTITTKENVSVVKRFLESPEGSGFKLLPINGKAAFSSRLSSDGSDAHFAVKMINLND
ncbi:MAG: antitermination protein NusB [Eggerthellaceae bacterium]|nr:antitermination protein NusB [Eggerthellaceae bacterium]